MRIQFTAAICVAMVGMFAASEAAAQTARLVTQRVDDSHTIALEGNTRPEATPANDRGRVADDTALDHMQLLLKRPPAAEAALRRFIDALHTPGSASFHHWLSAAEFGAAYGPNEADIGAVTGWLTAHGFTVNQVQTGRTMIDFSGTAGQVRQAFHTEIHALDVRGTKHIANMSDPAIPAALAGVVNGIVSLHDFRPHTNFKARPGYTYNGGLGTAEAVVPADLATIYNLNPLLEAGISGQGQSIVVIEDTDVYSTKDWTSFRAKFGLAAYSGGSFAQIHPAPPKGKNNCKDPGTVAGNEVEAELDAQWASAAAPSAAIELAACKDTKTTFGGLIALNNLINSASPPAIVSISYGECEAENGAAANAAYIAAYQQAVALGTSVFVAAGDEGGASCDANTNGATHGLGVSGFASTPYNVAVGGTDFGDTAAGLTATYWSGTNGPTYGSALSYIPEIPWNSSCGSAILAASFGYAASYGPGGFCNSIFGELLYLTTASGSGGPSSCARGKVAKKGVVGGTCQGTAKPGWQSVLGNPADGVRDIPDVSLFAANGAWSHYYLFCDTDAADGGGSCAGAPSTWLGAGGTSFASPILAAIQALVNQKQGGRQGNPNPVYYALANAEYGSTGSAPCTSGNGNAIGASCVFNDVTVGDMDVDCAGANDCYRPGGGIGVLSVGSAAFNPAFAAGTGWDFATGLGSVNATNLVNTW